MDSVRHLLPLIVSSQTNFSYKQGGLAEFRTHICSTAVREAGKVQLGRQDSYSGEGEFLKPRKAGQKVVSSHKILGMKRNQIQSSKLIHPVTGSDCEISQSWTWGNTGDPRGAGEESFECFLLTSLLVLQTDPDGRKSLLRPVAGPFSKSWPSATAQGQAARAAGKDSSPTQAQPVLHDDLET